MQIAPGPSEKIKVYHHGTLDPQDNTGRRREEFHKQTSLNNTKCSATLLQKLNIL